MKLLSSLHKISVFALFIFFSLSASGGDPYRPTVGAGEAGMGSVCIMRNGFWSAFHNQASLAGNSSLSLGINYNNRYSIKELSTRSIGVVIPSGKASLGALYSHFGYSDFSRDMAGLGCGLKLTDKISAGVQIDYFYERVSGEYDNSGFVTFEGGIILQPNENFKAGIHLFNPIPNSLRKNTLPTTLRIGIGTDLSNVLFAGAEAEMISGNKLLIRSGFEYEAAKNLLMRGGFCTNNNSFSFGLGYLTKIAKLDIGFVTHERLGITSSVSLIFKIH